MKAKDIMSTSVVTIDGSASVSKAIAAMKAHKVRSLIVERRSEDDAYGMVTQRDIVYKVIAVGADPATVKIADIMAKPLVVVNMNLDVKYVARLLANTGLSRAPVVGDHKLQGVVSLTDIVESL
jgi:CBS domain-containing protein